MMFVDESGDPGYPPNDDWRIWSGSDSYIRVGVIIHGWKWHAWHKSIANFKQTHGLTWDAEIKASDIRRGKKAFSGWSESRRNFFLHDFLKLLGSHQDIHILGVGINKRLVDSKKSPRIANPAVRSLEFLLEMYHAFLGQTKDKSGIVVLDPVQEKSEDNLRYFQSFLQNKSARFQPPRIVESTFFAKSHTCNMIQVADICSNVFYRYVRGDLKPTAEFKSIARRFWQKGGKTLGVKTWP